MYKSAIKYITLFSSIITLILGVIVMCNPFATSVVINYLLVIALGITGIAEICKFASMQNKSGWDLVLGILCLMACFMFLSNDVLFTEVTAGYVLAAVAIIGGIGRFITAAEVHKAGFSMAGFIISGIIFVLLGICMIMLPVITQGMFYWVLGIFMVTSGIVGSISALCISTKKLKKVKAENNY